MTKLVGLVLIGCCFLCFSCHSGQAATKHEVKEEAIGVSETYNLIEGRWIVDSVNPKTITIPSFCYEIGKGAVFEFKDNGSLMVYPNGVTKACGIYGYKIDESMIQVVNSDMIMLVDYRYSNGSLLLNSKTFFRWKDEEVQDTIVIQSLQQGGVTVYLSRLK